MDCSFFSLTQFCLLDPGGCSSFTTHLHSPNVLDLDGQTCSLYWVLIIMWFVQYTVLEELKPIGE